MKKLFLYLLLVLGFAACRKDMEETTIVDTVYTPPVIKVNGTLAGQVTDEQGQVLEGAVVRLGSLQQTTGAGGFFCLPQCGARCQRHFCEGGSTRLFP